MGFGARPWSSIEKNAASEEEMEESQDEEDDCETAPAGVLVGGATSAVCP